MGKSFQLELFKSQPHPADNSKKDKYRPKFFEIIKTYETAISLIIVISMTSLIAFGLGVEKGKRLAELELEQVVVENAHVQTVETPPAQIQAQPKQTQPDTATVVKKPEKIQNATEYTIQVASFKTHVYAKKEAQRLEDKGVVAHLLTIGQYVCVCVGNFQKRQDAKIAQNRLRETYNDCYIRRL